MAERADFYDYESEIYNFETRMVNFEGRMSDLGSWMASLKITGSVLVIILQGNIFVELRTNLYLCRR